MAYVCTSLYKQILHSVNVELQGKGGRSWYRKSPGFRLWSFVVINGGNWLLVKRSAGRCGLSTPTPFSSRTVSSRTMNSERHAEKEVGNGNWPSPAVALK